MKKNKAISLILALVLLVGLCSCGKNDGRTISQTISQADAGDGENQDSGENLTEYSFTDDLGREIVLNPAEIRRAATLIGSYADVWVLAGGEVCASADDAWEDFDLPLGEDAVNLGKINSLNLELLLSSEPDLVIASSKRSDQLEMEEALTGAGIPVAYFDVQGFGDYLRLLKICTDINGTAELYEKYGEELKVKIDGILDSHRDDGRKVLTMRASASSIRAKGSDSTVLGQMLSDFGCVNIADDDESLLENLSVESIALANPDMIFFTETGDDSAGTKAAIEAMFEENPLWKELDAVKDGRVYLMEKRLYQLKPNSRWAEAYEKLEEILCGEE